MSSQNNNPFSCKYAQYSTFFRLITNSYNAHILLDVEEWIRLINRIRPLRKVTVTDTEIYAIRRRHITKTNAASKSII